jgi:hypothetical protein
MAIVNKKVTKTYNLELSEAEYYAILTLIGRVSYSEFRKSVDLRYSARLGRTEFEDFEILTLEEFDKFYDMLDENK